MIIIYVLAFKLNQNMWWLQWNQLVYWLLWVASHPQRCQQLHWSDAVKTGMNFAIHLPLNSIQYQMKCVFMVVPGFLSGAHFWMHLLEALTTARVGVPECQHTHGEQEQVRETSTKHSWTDWLLAISDFIPKIVQAQAPGSDVLRVQEFPCLSEAQQSTTCQFGFYLKGRMKARCGC